MKKQYQYWVYIVSSISKKIYIGVTNNLDRRISEHKEGKIEGFTKKYNIKKLVYYEETNDIYCAIEREKQLKKWRREKKIKFVEKNNSKWKDLFNDL
jgi:putative endonuclease